MATRRSDLPLKVMTVKVPLELEERLERLAKTSGASKSSLVREALNAYLDEDPKPDDGPTVFDRVASTIGIARGPGLSATDRMDGYGR